KHQSQSSGGEEFQSRWQQHRSAELPHFLQLMHMLREAPSREEFLRILRDVAVACAWKLKLAVLVVAGVWSDEMAVQVERTTQQFYGWTRDPKLLHEDVMTVVGAM